MRKPQITHARIRLVAHIHGYISINYTSTGPRTLGYPPSGLQRQTLPCPVTSPRRGTLGIRPSRGCHCQSIISRPSGDPDTGELSGVPVISSPSTPRHLTVKRACLYDCRGAHPLCCATISLLPTPREPCHHSPPSSLCPNRVYTTSPKQAPSKRPGLFHQGAPHDLRIRATEERLAASVIFPTRAIVGSSDDLFGILSRTRGIAAGLRRTCTRPWKGELAMSRAWWEAAPIWYGPGGADVCIVKN